MYRKCHFSCIASVIQEGPPAGIGTGGVSLSTQFATNDNASFTDCYKDLYSLRYFHLVNTGLPWCHWPAFLGPYTGWQWYWVQPGSSALQHQTPASALWLDGASSKPRPLSDGPSRLTARTHPERQRFLPSPPVSESELANWSAECWIWGFKVLWKSRRKP